MDAYIILLYFACPARALLTSSFTRVFHVPLSDYVDNVLAVDKSSSSPIECATTCDVNCYSFTHDEETRECKTYSKELCTDVGVNQSSVIQTFVRKRKDHIHGLDMIHLLTRQGSSLRIELVSWYNDTAYAQYSFFMIADESSKYRLSVSGFSGNVSYDAMAYHNGFKFSTYDNDNSNMVNCASWAVGGWWYKGCYDSNLNGPYRADTGLDIYKSMAWIRFYAGREYVPMMKTRMLVKMSGV
ncbi:fibrinogen-like protein A [Pecten maximus]|uniref:fibrinogen-like protein A n=1 Tax=Pecten maximus TaxID=6579 RepID=UPI001458774A|nr:fibrinogen-like protein A [Pecten maximus]